MIETAVRAEILIDTKAKDGSEVKSGTRGTVVSSEWATSQIKLDDGRIVVLGHKYCLYWKESDGD